MNARSSSSEEADDNETVISDTELSDLSETLELQNTHIKPPSQERDRSIMPDDYTRSQSPETDWILTNERPEPSQKESCSQKRKQAVDWSDDECPVPKTQRQRKEYTYDDKKAILDYILEKNAFNQVKGRQLWETMVDLKLCRERTWQSLKEHYIKQIIPNIRIFHLPKNVEKLCLAPFPKYKEKKRVHFKEKCLEEFKEISIGINGSASARHLGTALHSSTRAPTGSTDCPNSTPLVESQISNSRLGTQNLEHPGSSPTTSDNGDEWISSYDKKQLSQIREERLSQIPGKNPSQSSYIPTEEVEVMLNLLKGANSLEISETVHETDCLTNVPSSKTPELLLSQIHEERPSQIPGKNLSQSSNIPTEEIEVMLNLLEGANSLETSETVLETDCLMNVPSSKTPELLCSEGSADKETEIINTDAETTEVAKDCAESKEKPLEQSSNVESISNCSSSDDEALILLVSEAATGKKRKENNFDTETSEITKVCTDTKEQSVSQSSEPDSLSDPSSGDEQDLILPIRKRVWAKSPKPDKTNTRSVTTGDKPQQSRNWLSLYVTQKPSSSNSVIFTSQPETANSEELPLRSKRREYTYEDKKAILSFISETQSYNRVKGRQFWQLMAESKVCPGRTWQSLKEHYTKQIIPNLCIFRLSEEEERKFLAPFV